MRIRWIEPDHVTNLHLVAWLVGATRNLKFAQVVPANMVVSVLSRYVVGLSSPIHTLESKVGRKKFEMQVYNPIVGEVNSGMNR